MVVIVEPGIGQNFGLITIDHTQSHASLQPQGFDTLDHIGNVAHVFLLGRAPGGTHTEASCTTGLGSLGFLDHLLHFH